MGLGDIWGSVDDAVSATGGALWETGKSVVKATTAPVRAPAGIIWDIASSPSDWTQDIKQGGGNFFADVFDPLVNQETITGAVVAPVMRAFEHVYREEISEPTAAGITLIDRAIDEGNAGILFSSKAWDEANKIAQGRSIGQAATQLVMNDLMQMTTGERPWDPKDEDSWNDLHEVSPLLMSMSSGTIDAGVRWFADPGMILGKATKLAKAARKVSTLTQEQGQQASVLFATDRAQKIAGLLPVRPGVADRIDNLNGKISNGVHTPGWLDGKNATEVYKGYTPLHTAPNGTQMASLLADTNKIENVAERVNERRRIMAVFAGDLDTVSRYEEKQAYITDILNNMGGQALTDSKMAVVADDVFNRYATMGERPPFWAPTANPDRIAEAERQLKNLPDMRDWLIKEESRIGELLGKHQGAMRQVFNPGRAENRLIAREVGGRGLTRSGTLNTGVEKVDEAAEKVLAPLRHGVESIYQYHPSAAPLRVVWAVAGPAVKGGITVGKKTGGIPTGLYDSFRNTRPEGFVNVNDADDSIRQVDAFLRKAGADEQTRAKFSSEMAGARESYDRARILQKAEKEVHKIYFKKYGIEDLPGFIDQLTDAGMLKRESMMASLNGRAYSSTLDAGKAFDPTEFSGPLSKMKKNALRQEALRAAEPRRQPTGLRVDQLDDDGVPVALPFLDTQDASLLPMLDIAELDRALRKHHNVFRATARAWKEETDLSLAGDIKHRFGDIGLTGFKAYDHISEAAIHTLNTMNRLWKFSVLMRLGYPMRVMMDNHMRVGAAFGASVIVNGLKEGVPNLAYNLGRHAPIIGANKRAALRLESRQMTLEAELDNVVAYEANQAAWKEIRSIEKRLPKLKSERRKAELAARREVLMDAHPEDMIELRRQLDDILEQRRTRSYKQTTKRRMGDKGATTEEGYYLPGAYEGTYGDAYRAAASADKSYMNLGDIAEKELQQAFNRSHSGRLYDPEQVGHIDAWEHALNFQIRNSELARIVLGGGDSDDVLHFLTKTPRGREVARKFPYLGGDPERWAVNVERMVHQYAPTEELRDALLKNKVTTGQLQRMFKNTHERPQVHGRELDANLETGRTASIMSWAQRKFYQRVAKSEDAMSRHPLFVTMFRDKQAELYRQRLSLAKRQGRPLTNKDIEAVTHGAREYAKKQVNRTLFEMGSTTEMAHFLRFASPFFGAWQEGMNRWWRIVSNDPTAIRKFQLMFDAPRRLGLVVNNEGDPVQPGDEISDDHYILLQMPHAWGGPDPSKPGGQGQFRVSETSFNLIFQGGGLLNPGFGPFVQIPVNQLAIHNADKLEYNDAGEPTNRFAKTIEAILPLGPNKGLLDPVISPSMRSGYAFVGAKWFGKQPQLWRQYEAQIARDLSIEFQLQNGRPANRKEQALILEQAGERATAMASMKFLTSMLSPASVQVQSKFSVELQAYRRLQEHARTNKLGYFWADEQFIKKFGEAFFPILQSSTKNEAGLPSTSGTVAQLKKFKDLRNKVSPDLYRMIVGNMGEGAYSPTARAWMTGEEMRAGSSETFVSYSDPAEAMTDSAVSQGWNDYTKFINRLNFRAHQLGYKSYLDDPMLVEQKRAGMAALAERNPQWWLEFNSFNPAEFDSLVDDMKIIASDSRLKADPERTDIFALQQYLTAREEVTRQLQARGRLGGSSSPEAQSNADLVRAFTRQVSALVESNTYFESYMWSTIERDPYLAEVA